MVISLLINSIEGLLARPMMANLARLQLPTSTCWSQIQGGCTGSLQDVILCNARCNIVQCSARCNLTKHNNTWGTGCLQCNAMQCDKAWDTFQKYDYNADALFAMCTGSRWFQQELDFLAAVDTYILKSPFTLQLFFELCPDSWHPLL